MKRFLTAALFLIPSLMLAMGTALPKLPATVTNIVQSAPVQAPSAPARDLVAAGAFARPALAVGADGTLYVAAEGPGMGSVHRFTSTGGKWTGGLVVTASKTTALRTYGLDALEDIISFRYGKKEGGKLHGPGTYRNGKEQFEGFSTGAARLAMSPVGPILMSKDGIYKNLATGKIGKYNAGLTGEKFAFAIDPVSGTWATAVNGYTRDGPGGWSSISVNGKRITAFQYTPDQGVDMNYPSVCIATSGVWMASVNEGRLRVQCVKDGKTRWPIDKTPSLGEATQGDRCPPRLIVTSKGVTAIWRLKDDILMVPVEQGLTGQKPVRIASGAFPAVVVGPGGRLHMVYVSGGLRYKEVKP